MILDAVAFVASLTELRDAADQALAGMRRLVAVGEPAPLAPVEVAPPRQLKPAAPHTKSKKLHRPAAKVHRPAAGSQPPAKLPPRIPGTLDLKAIAAKDGLRAAADASGIPYQTLWKRARAGGWKTANGNRKRHPATATKPAAKKPPVPSTSRKAPVSNSPLRRCAHCEQYTTMDPCERCHQPWHPTKD